MAIETTVPLLTHDHAGTGSRATYQLAQLNTHNSADTDVASSSLHHTIGPGTSQAASGSHLHAGAYIPVETSTGNRYSSNTSVQQFATSGNNTVNYYPSARFTTPAAFLTVGVTGAGSIYTLNRSGLWSISTGMRYEPLPGNGGESYVAIIVNSTTVAAAEGGNQVGYQTRSTGLVDYFTAGNTIYSQTFIYAATPGPVAQTQPNYGWTWISLYWLHD